MSITRYGEEVPGMKGKVLSAILQLDGQEYMAIDGGPQFTFTEAISFFGNFETQEEVDELWKKLSEGGEKGSCGWLKDKYGASWQIIPTALGELMQDKDAEKSKKSWKQCLKWIKLT